MFIHIHLKEFHDFYIAYLEDDGNKRIIGDLIHDKEFLFGIIQRELKKIKSNFQTSFQLYEDYNNPLKNHIECSEHYLDFYIYLLEYVSKHPNDYNKVYKYAVIKY